jgi:AcrR family transcriptional regulator
MPLTDDVVVRRRVTKQADASAQRRDEILDAAVEAFTEKGFNGSSLRDIAARAGMSHNGVLHHFPDKAGILEAILDRRIGRAASQFGLDAHDGVQFLRSLIALAERDVRDPGDLRMYRVIAAEALAPSHPAHGYQRRWYHQVREAATLALEDLDRQGLLRSSIDIPIAAAQIAGLRDGLDPQWLLDPDEVDLVGAVTAALRSYTTADLGGREGSAH